MEEPVLLRTASFGGYKKEDVLKVLDQINEIIQQLEKGYISKKLALVRVSKIKGNFRDAIFNGFVKEDVQIYLKSLAEKIKNYEEPVQEPPESLAEKIKNYEEPVQEPPEIKSKFTALGLSGSGKTCFMTGMYYKMSGGIGGYTLKADDDNDVKLTGYYENIQDNSKGFDRFPDGTDQTAKYIFDLQYVYKHIADFEWTDYRGNILTEKKSGNPEEYEQLKKDIYESDMLYIFVDGATFDETESYTENDFCEIVVDKCARYINHFISDYTKVNKQLPPIAIIVTKYDIVVQNILKMVKQPTNEEVQAKLNEIIKKSFSTLFPDTSKYGGGVGYTSMTAVIPVSLGAEISRDDYKGKLKPLNMHIPVFMGAWLALYRQLKKGGLSKELEIYTENALSMLESEIEESGISLYLDGQTGSIRRLAEGYFERSKGL